MKPPEHATDCIIQRPAPDCPECNPAAAENTCPTCTGQTRETTHMICMDCGTDYTTDPTQRLTPHGLEVLREALAEVGRLRDRTPPPLPRRADRAAHTPQRLYPRTDTAAYERLANDPGTPNWAGVVLGAGRVYADLTGRALPAPDPDDTFEDIARERLGQLGAAIGLELLNHAIDNDDERPLEAAAAEAREHSGIPEALIAAIAPAVSTVLNAIVTGVEHAREESQQ